MWNRQRTSEIKAPKKLDLVGSPSNTRLYAAFLFETEQNELPFPNECFSYSPHNFFQLMLLPLKMIDSPPYFIKKLGR